MRSITQVLSQFQSNTTIDSIECPVHDVEHLVRQATNEKEKLKLQIAQMSSSHEKELQMQDETINQLKQDVITAYNEWESAKKENLSLEEECNYLRQELSGLKIELEKRTTEIEEMQQREQNYLQVC